MRFHIVHRHNRGNVDHPIDDYERGKGGGAPAVAPFSGRYEGSDASRPTPATEEAKQQVTAKLGFFERRRKEKEAKKKIRERVREEMEAKAAKEKSRQMILRIRAEEEQRAREGPAWKRALKSQARSAASFVGKSVAETYGVAPKKRKPQARRRSGPKAARR